MFKFSAEYFDPEATLECGQVFRFEAKGGGYVVRSLDKECFLRKEGASVVVDPSDEAYFRRYFDLDEDYERITRELRAFPELAAAVDFGKGIRILRQDFYEATFSFIVSANNNIARIKGIIERLSAAYGSGVGGGYAFPTLEQLKKATVPELKKLGLGYRAEYIYDSARAFENLPPLSEKTDAETAHKILCSLKGVGPKVADCIILFGLHITRSYPVDTWIFKANSSAELDTPKKVREHFLDRYGDNAGYAQQYIFYRARRFGVQSPSNG